MQVTLLFGIVTYYVTLATVADLHDDSEVDVEKREELGSLLNISYKCYGCRDDVEHREELNTYGDTVTIVSTGPVTQIMRY
ncbi:uncharacterized protein EDB91DRAFT_1147960 [Suillus paluster]|uniref:uncharacterized protein n=1 Tax=Suillus paluster TaxID=48578 RepID=UPI001B85C2BD|nr:uncharacterized protein EDB91DRAFT_1147960 [Suillus paluster]KAG1733907.1 hypothetical protein EDB91DRAFT_1147960 [Suillus paluster]